MGQGDKQAHASSQLYCQSFQHFGSRFYSRLISEFLSRTSSLMSCKASVGGIVCNTARAARYRPLRDLRRSFSAGRQCRTDGVFRELTAQRVPTPWIEAFRQQQKIGNASTSEPVIAQAQKKRDLAPKRMKDSHFSIVR